MSSDPPKYATILSLAEFGALRSARPERLGTIVCTSGGYDPIHPGHVTCMVESKSFGDTLVVVVNGDAFLRGKKGAPFQDLRTRALIVAGIRGVDYVIPFEIEGDPTVCEALRVIRPQIFTKGGDRKQGQSLPSAEESVCRELGIEIRDEIGLAKEWSSSDALAAWGRFWSSTRS